MASTFTECESKARLRALDPGLPLLASQAAIELDTLIAGEEIQPRAVHRLARILSNSFETPIEAGQGATSVKSLMDPATVNVLSRALDTSGHEVKDLEELIDKARSVANRLVETSKTAEQGTLERARTFCVALSRYAAAYRQSIHDLQPQHPFRR